MNWVGHGLVCFAAIGCVIKRKNEGLGTEPPSAADESLSFFSMEESLMAKESLNFHGSQKLYEDMRREDSGGDMTCLHLSYSCLYLP